MTDQDQFLTVLGPDAQMKGELVLEQNTRIMGRFEGSINATNQLHIAEGACCRAQVAAGEITVDGMVEGNMTAAQRIHLSPTAQVQGDLTSPKLVIDEGAVVYGTLNIGEPNPDYAPPAPAPVQTGESAGGLSMSAGAAEMDLED